MLIQTLLVFFAIAAGTNAAVLQPARQATRQEVIKRATRVRSAKRATGSPVPIACGSSQQFYLQYSNVGNDRFSQEGKYAIVRNQAVRPYSSSKEMAGVANPLDASTGVPQIFKLDSSCKLVAVGGPFANYYMNTESAISSAKLYWDEASYTSTQWTPATCSISPTTNILKCANAVKTQFISCTSSSDPEGISRGATHITDPNGILNNCQTLTITAIPYYPN